MNGMTRKYVCPSFSIWEYEIDQQGTPDSIRYVLMTFAYGGWTIRRFDRGVLKKTKSGHDIEQFKLADHL